MKTANINKFLPILIGLFLAAVSILIGQIPLAAAQFSGMTVIGSHMGYLWAVLIMAWLHHEKWHKSFTAGFLTMTVTNIFYYSTLLAFWAFDIGRAPSAIPPLHLLRSFVFWTVISAIVCALAATAVWMAIHAKSKLLNYGIFFVAYLGLIGVTFWSNRFFNIGWHGIGTVSPINYVQTWRFIGHLFEIGFALVVTTILLGIGLRNTITYHPKPFSKEDL